jgi:Uma2 family endonuclease
VSAQTQPHLTPEHYLEIERESEFRNEYYNGRMYPMGDAPSAMAGGTYRHSKLTHSLSRRLGNALEGRPCEVSGSDIRVCTSPDGFYTYPDIVVVCGEPKFADGRSDTLLNPALIVEVLSHSTEGYDRGFKFAQYRRIESLEEYALVSQTEPRVEVFRRQPGGHWLLSEFVGLEAAAHFDSLSASVPLAEIYDKVTFEEAAEPPTSGR